MNLFSTLDGLAAARGDGLRPELRALLDRGPASQANVIRLEQPAAAEARRADPGRLDQDPTKTATG